MTLRPNRALKIYGARDVRLADGPLPEVDRESVLIEVTAVGLCGSDRHTFVGGNIGGVRPARALVLGHEVSGRVVSDGALGGQRVVIDPSIPCRTCPTCAKGLGHLCPTVRFAGFDSIDGGLQRYLAWPADRCVVIDERIGTDDAPLLEVLGICLHALDLAGVQPGARVGVFGAGPVGLMLIRTLVASGAEVVMATDTLSHRVEAARASGARAVALVEGNEAHLLNDLDFAQLDLAFECSGEESGLNQAVRALAPGGRVVLLGIPAGRDSVYEASPARRKEIGLQWVRRMADGDLARAVAMVAAQRISLDGLVTHRFRLDEGADAFAMLEARDGLKVIVQPQA